MLKQIYPFEAGSTLNAASQRQTKYYDVVIVGGGSAGVSVCSTLYKSRKDLNIAVVEPNHKLFYQPGWSMRGGGVTDRNLNRQLTKKFIPTGVDWLQNSVTEFHPEQHLIKLDRGSDVHYAQLIIATGLEMNWDGIPGLRETLGRNGVTSNYRYDLALYTWKLVHNFKGGKALFTQAPMPIKSVGAPQQAMFLAADYWHQNGVMKRTDIEFYTAEKSIFRIQDYVPTLKRYLNKFHVLPKYRQVLKKIDGESQTAFFTHFDAQGQEQTSETKFDMIHVCPPQQACRSIRESSLCDDGGLLDVKNDTLNHSTYGDIWGLGDIINTPNAKSLAAVRKQVPVVAANVLNALDGQEPSAIYSGYSSCPLIVERGRVVLAEFDYSGRHCPSFPKWLNDGTKATRFAWFVNLKLLPYLFWHQLLYGADQFTKLRSLKSSGN